MSTDDFDMLAPNGDPTGTTAELGQLEDINLQDLSSICGKYGRRLQQSSDFSSTGNNNSKFTATTTTTTNYFAATTSTN